MSPPPALPDLGTALRAYVELVEREVWRSRSRLADGEPLVEFAKDLEHRKEFDSLARASAREFTPAGEESLPVNVGIYFRLSGLYHRVLDGDLLDPALESRRFRDAFTREHHTVHHLAPLLFVEFDRDRIECGSFKIRRFTLAELTSLLRCREAKTFFPYAAVDAGDLQDYWFLYATEKRRRQELGEARFCLPTCGTERFPPTIEDALGHLALYDWQRAAIGPGCLIIDANRNPALGGRAIHLLPLKRGLTLARPPVPIVFSSSDCLTEWPERPPDLSALDIEPSTGPMRIDLHARQGEAAFTLTEGGTTEEFAVFMQRLAELRTAAQVGGEKWAFVNTAIGFLQRAFSSSPPDEVLWCVTAIEALLGDKVDSLTNLLKRRVCAVLASNRAKRDFLDIYEFRSSFVHGRTMPLDMAYHLLAQKGWDMSRRVTLWMLRYLEFIADRCRDDKDGFPCREHLLRVLDLDRDSQHWTRFLLGGLPEGFPAVRPWSER